MTELGDLERRERRRWSRAFWITRVPSDVAPNSWFERAASIIPKRS